MHAKGRDGNGDQRRLQREVLALALVEHPLRLTLPEVRKVVGPPTAVEPAVAALVEDGLLAWEGEEILPTAAAIRFNEFEPMEPPHG